MSSADKFLETFPFPSIPPIIGQPNYESISSENLSLNSNSASIQSHLCDGALGLLYLTVPAPVYNTLSLIPFNPPVNPGPDPIIPPGSTGPQIADIRLKFATATKLFKHYDAVDKALKQQLLGCVDYMFVRALRNRYIGYANVITFEILTHL